MTVVKCDSRVCEFQMNGVCPKEEIELSEDLANCDFYCLTLKGDKVIR